jgi:predicted RNA-binding protein with RPS1 domain
LKIIEINRHRNRLILSERQALQERRDVMKERLIEELREGEVRKGRVSSICDFGAFVDVGGADGLVHLSELSWSRVRHPSEVLHVGQEIDVFVLGINADEKKIALSIKRTQAEPWSRVAANYDVNQLVIGTVTQLANFGAFARIEDGIEGLVHVSELSDARINHPRELVSEGQDLLLRIIRIDPQRRRMGLSLRRAVEATDEEVLEALGPEAVELKHRLIELEANAGLEPEPEVEEDETDVSAEASESASDDSEMPESTMAAAFNDAGSIADEELESATTDESAPVETADAVPAAAADEVESVSASTSDEVEESAPSTADEVEETAAEAVDETEAPLDTAEASSDDDAVEAVAAEETADEAPDTTLDAADSSESEDAVADEPDAVAAAVEVDDAESTEASTAS